MSNLLTTERLEEIKSGQNGWPYLEVRELLAHIAAQAAHIAALQSGLELLVKVSCREQRYKCENELAIMGYPMPSHAQNAPCPDIADVLQKWQKAKGTNNG